MCSSDLRVARGDTVIAASGGFFGNRIQEMLRRRGANLIVVDDLVRDNKEVQNPDIRETEWEWFRRALITRLQPEKSAEVAARFPTARVNAAARTITLPAPAPAAPRPGEPHVAVVAAGTSDLPVAEEAAEGDAGDDRQY